MTPRCSPPCGARSGTASPARRCASGACSRSSTRRSSRCWPRRRGCRPTRRHRRHRPSTDDALLVLRTGRAHAGDDRRRQRRRHRAGCGSPVARLARPAHRPRRRSTPSTSSSTTRARSAARLPRLATVAPTETSGAPTGPGARAASAALIGTDRALASAAARARRRGVRRTAALPAAGRPDRPASAPRCRAARASTSTTLRKRAAESVGRRAPDARSGCGGITVGTLVQVVLPAIAAAALIAAFGRTRLPGAAHRRSATPCWWLRLAGLRRSPSCPGCSRPCPRSAPSPPPLPSGRVYALQLAVVVHQRRHARRRPARIAVNIRFFQRHGVPPGGGRSRRVRSTAFARLHRAGGPAGPAAAVHARRRSTSTSAIAVAAPAAACCSS